MNWFVGFSLLIINPTDGVDGENYPHFKMFEDDIVLGLIHDDKYVDWSCILFVIGTIDEGTEK